MCKGSPQVMGGCSSASYLVHHFHLESDGKAVFFVFHPHNFGIHTAPTHEL